MQVFISPLISDSYVTYLNSKGFMDVQRAPSNPPKMETFVKKIVAPTVSEYTISKILTMCECFSGPGKDGGIYISEEVGFINNAVIPQSSFFVPLTIGLNYKVTPGSKERTTNYFGPVDAFVYSGEFAKAFVQNVDFRQPFDVIAMAMLGGDKYTYVPIAENPVKLKPDDDYKDGGYWSSFLRGYQPCGLTYESINTEYIDFINKSVKVSDYFNDTYGMKLASIDDIKYIKDRTEALKDLEPILEQEECES